MPYPIKDTCTCTIKELKEGICKHCFLIKCQNCKNIDHVYHPYFCAIFCRKCQSKIENPKHKGCHVGNECYYPEALELQ